MELPKSIDKNTLKVFIKTVCSRSYEKPILKEELISRFSFTDTREIRLYVSAAKKYFKVHIANGKGGKGWCGVMDWRQYKGTYYKKMKQAVTMIKEEVAMRKEFAECQTPTFFDQDMDVPDEFKEIVATVIKFNGGKK